jgi:hypothetical protein
MEPITLSIGTVTAESFLDKILQVIIKNILSIIILFTLVLLVIFQINKNKLTKKRV